MRDTTVSHLLTQLGAAVGMPDLAFDANGQCHLLIDKQYLIQILHHPRQYILMSCSLGTHTPDAQLLNTLLKANFGQVAGGIVLAQAPDDRLCVQICLPCSSAHTNELLESLEALVIEAERWNAHLMHPGHAAAPADQQHPILVQTV